MNEPLNLSTLQTLRQDALRGVAEAVDLAALESVRVAWLGRKGAIPQLLKDVVQLSIEDKKIVGKAANDLRVEIETAIEEKARELQRALRARELSSEAVDLTIPGAAPAFGRRHPVSQVLEELITLFQSMGFSVAQGPEVETERNNFEALNIPASHPARDMHDTFYLKTAAPGWLLRTHTSPVQIRAMEIQKPPIQIIAPGKVYRHEAMDATHLPVFHQLEGLYVDEGVSFANLKSTLSDFAARFFGSETKTRFRPSFFPFTEPSAEVDVSCMFCQGKGCRICKGTGWIEMMGAGMVHPNVLKAVQIDPERYTGFAFGMGVERIAMIRYGVGDLRLFYENDVRFLEQFLGVTAPS